MTRRRRSGAIWQNAAQVLGEVRRGGVAVLLPLRQRLEAGPFQLGRDVADELARGLRLVVAHLPQQLPECRSPGTARGRESIS